MQEAAKLLAGEHDFRAFTEELDPTTENTVRKLRSVEVYESEGEVWIEVVGTAFLRGMMRRMAGALLEVGDGKRDVCEIGALIESRGEAMHLPVVLPAKGLTLIRVRYNDPPRDCRRK
jgi:tRNA pseudouridine38-40 synthase